ncbi:ABC transporter ATP-binding protein [Micrococcales bacterium 31B]|nr:ABC transporter ATP-binding protein [Micrococcales bacterium 31B]
MDGKHEHKSRGRRAAPRPQPQPRAVTATPGHRRVEDARVPTDALGAELEQPAPLARVLRLFAGHGRALTLVGLLIVASAAATLASPFLIRGIVDDALPQHDLKLLAYLTLGLVAVVVANRVLALIQSLISTRVGHEVMHELRDRVFRHVSSLSFRFFTQTRSGEVQGRIAHDVGNMKSVVTTSFTELVQAVATVAAVLTAMLVLDPWLALFSFVTLPLAVWINVRVGRMRKKITAQRQKYLADMQTSIQESLSVSGILLAKSMGQTSRIQDEFSTLSGRLSRLEVEAVLAGRWRMSVAQLALTVIPAATYFLGGVQFELDRAHMTIGTLVAFVALQQQVFGPLVDILKVTNKLHASMVLFGRVFAYLDITPDITEVESPQRLVHVKGRVELRDVSFTHPGATRPTVDAVSAEIPVGTTLAVVGHTGSGKTTLGYLLTRIIEPDSGAVTIDGIDIRDTSFEDLARAISVVAQEPYLMHASVYDNLRYGRPNATRADVEAAARIAQIHDAIEALPEGYETLVGERGFRFSGGERQRLALARSIVCDAPILLLDEATSALDPVTERAMTEALAALHGKRTTIVIAHRLSTVRYADHIIVLENGRIVERGCYDDLVTAGGQFSRLVHDSAVTEATAT